ncbi:MAG: Holliday junction branch migration protein RuvA, partial [Actinobacteria bacterium]|nr:Holliday junction branch migration protein RuvA [Actinomycetota bacterium]
MIGSLRGVVLDRFASGELLVEVGGVGYRVTVAAGTHAVIDGVGAPVFLHVHTHVREDAIVLYGFTTADERACFEALLGAHGVGPALAINILSSLSPVSLRRAVSTDDVDALTVVPGVGRKTA